MHFVFNVLKSTIKISILSSTTVLSLRCNNILEKPKLVITRIHIPV